MKDAVVKAQMDMTLDVMAHSLVYWTQDVVGRGLMGEGGRIFAMTSAGGTRVLPYYGPVSAAKAALESHIRQLAAELAPRGITANAIRAGVTDTPALQKIPGQRRDQAGRRREPERPPDHDRGRGSRHRRPRPPRHVLDHRQRHRRGRRRGHRRLSGARQRLPCPTGSPSSFSASSKASPNSSRSRRPAICCSPKTAASCRGSRSCSTW